MSEPQSFANHTRLHGPYHYFAAPVLIINVIWRIVELVRAPGWAASWEVVIALALATTIAVVRTYPLKVQDRVIRLEERLRLEKLLAPDLASRISEFSEGQLCSLRFCDDRELPDLAAKVLADGTRKRADIKRQITIWKPDEFRV